MNIPKPFILECNRVPLLLLSLLQHPIVPTPSILHLPILILIHYESLCLALLHQLILRLLVPSLEYPWLVLLQVLQ